MKGQRLLLAVLIIASFGQSVQEASAKGFRIGPTVKFGLPHPVNLTLDAKVGDYFSAAVGGGYLNFSISDIGFKISNYDLRGRFHPFGGDFFIGSAIGKHSIGANKDATLTADSVSVDVNIDVEVEALYVTPQLGWLWIFDSGFTLGFELGWFVPLGASSTVTPTVKNSELATYLDAAKQTTEYQDAESDLKDNLDRVGKTQLPYLTIFRIGFLF